jgi:molybdopterin/thiamine biosynthesis adenylyltransferase
MGIGETFSRPIATAQSLGASARDPQRFVDKHVLLTGEADVLSTANGQDCATAALRLLPRLCRKVSVSFPPKCDSVAKECFQVAREIEFGQAIRFYSPPVALGEFDAVLSVGTHVPRKLASTVINSNGWVARVASTGDSIAADCSERNPIGALGAASLGVGEIFKVLVQMRPERGAAIPPTCFSLFSYHTGDNDPGLPMPAILTSDITLIGAGAIGNAVVYLLRALQIQGRLDIVDYQDFGRENLGTCMCVGLDDIGQSKATVLASLFRSRPNVHGYKELVSDYIRRVEVSGKYPAVVLSALDDIEPRHELQGLWPDIVIDGAIGPFECQVSCHPWGKDIACLRCLFRQVSRSSELLAQLATGLRQERLATPDSIVTAEDVANAPSEKKEWLKSRLGRPVCSVWQEGLARDLSSAGLSRAFRPSVPFVASMSACMVVTELIRYLAGWEPVLSPRFQFDMFAGPALGQMLPQERRRDCICVTRSCNIEVVREGRRSIAR